MQILITAYYHVAFSTLCSGDVLLQNNICVYGILYPWLLTVGKTCHYHIIVLLDLKLCICVVLPLEIVTCFICICEFLRIVYMSYFWINESSL